ncbi:hypothetical protein BT63DRAFT_435407 [Microthyrium microscopicum]|uniref:VLRF1 domain-containing protein n=1 Tax=Microthyrium microscopicum TaxID=703497 RepID=A0A6A6UT78_9PEZI|nr:hypothetical protein BT63DRAFT_435407 [Microthyrium microscopicum]
MASITPEIVQKPLYVFQLPEELLQTLVRKTNGSAITEEAAPSKEVESQPEQSEIVQEYDKKDAAPAKATSCNLCGLSFPTLQEQRSHVKSDLHNYNLKQKIKGFKPVTEAEFDKLIGELDESISGSESSSSESEADDKAQDSTLTALLRRQAKISNPNDQPEVKQETVGQPLIWLGSSSLPPNISLGVYRVLFSKDELDDVVPLIQQKQFAPIVQGRKFGTNVAPANSNTPTYFLCMIGGGHFAAMVVSLAPKLVTTHKGAHDRQAVVLAHKTFHRYTTRRKQGGAQSTSDAAKGAAHSAGSSLRRANEAALATEIRALLAEWKQLINDCELVFIRATGSTNRRTLFGPYDGQVLRSNDPRNRGFPFTTRRATQSELTRAFVELTRVKVSYIDESALKQVAAPAPVPVDKPAAPKKVKLSAEEQAAQLHTTQLAALIKRAKVPALVSYISTNKIDLSTFTFSPANTHTPTPLHLAASLSSAPVVTALLTRCNANPTTINAESHTAISLTRDRATRDAFRLARHTLGESACDWTAAGVGSALTPAEAQARDAEEKSAADAEAAKETIRRKAETDRLRKADVDKEDADREKRVGKGQVLGEMSGAEKREVQARGMTPEMRMKLERERRARAAEERFRRAG